LAEVVDHLARVKTIDLTDVLKRTVWLRDGGLEVVPVDAFDGAAAWSFRALYHNRRDRPISLADCAALATCTRYDAHRHERQDAGHTARLFKIDVVALPNSVGERP
jgi:hypothetical protein